QKALKIYKKVSRCCTKRQPRCGQSSLREVERKTSDSQLVDLPTARHLAPVTAPLDGRSTAASPIITLPELRLHGPCQHVTWLDRPAHRRRTLLGSPSSARKYH